MATKAKLHGRPLHVARQIAEMYDKPRQSGESRRAWGKRLAVLVHELATQCNVEPSNFADYVPDRIVVAIARERTNTKLMACGVKPAAAQNSVVLPMRTTARARRNRTLAAAA